MSHEDLREKMKAIRREAIQRAVPSNKERRETLRFSKSIVRRLETELKSAGIDAQAQIEGSIAKDTWLAEETDIDLFMLLPKTYKREDFARVLNVAKKVAGENYLEAYAEHPYIEAKIDGFTVDFVPCFKIEGAQEAASSVDRTPLHTLYVKGKLSGEMKNEVRLLKRFMRGIGTYGAEIKVGGFSGYLCEVLTMHFGSFTRLLEAAANWRGREVIDIEGHYKTRESEARKIFQEPLIVVDPVDKGRNVASAVSIDKLNEFIAASRAFLKEPNINFVYPQPAGALSIRELAQTMEARGSTFIFLKTSIARTVPDVLWGQLYKSKKALGELIRHHGFILISDNVWSDEKETTLFLFELNSRSLPTVERHQGPPVEKKEECERFLKKYAGAAETLSGPRIGGDRWIVERRRKYTDVVDLLKDYLKDGGENIGNASRVSEAFKHGFEVWINNEVEKFYSENTDFASFLTEHLRGRPRWFQ